jgi:hypothetical protein
MTKIYDLSIPIEDSPSEPQPVKVEHKAHDTTVILDNKDLEKRVVYQWGYRDRLGHGYSCDVGRQKNRQCHACICHVQKLI